MPGSPTPPPPPAPAPTPPSRAGLRKWFCACTLRRCTARYERLVAPRKRALLSALEGHIVEIGPGTGPNLPYLFASPRAAARIARYTAVEPNPFVHEDLRARARSLSAPLTLVPRPLAPRDPDLPDACADAVVCTLVLCSVPDQRAALSEIARILRPGGTLVFIEHVAAPRRTLLRALQRAVRPAWRILGDGCEPDRETEGTLRDTSLGFARVDVERFTIPLPIIGPHIAGTAVRAASA